MDRKNQKRIVRELCKSLKEHMLKAVETFPVDFNGLHVRALLREYASNDKSEINKRAARELNKAVMHGQVKL